MASQGRTDFADFTRQIAELRRLEVGAAEAYVRSIGDQVGEPDLARVAKAIHGLLGTGRPFKVKDVKRALAVGILPAPVEIEPATGPAAPALDDDVPQPAVASDPESRRDTRYRFEQWANNPQCEANLLSAVHGVRMEEVAKAEGIVSSMGQSPFALARGQMFEGRLFRNGAALLLPELAREGILPQPKAAFRDFRLRRVGGPYQTLDAARAATSQMLAEAADGTARDPLLAAGATIRIPGGGMLPEAILVVDALVVRRDLQPVQVVVGEVKTYPDRAGYTDPAELAVARAQAGVYVEGLRLVAEELGLQQRLQVSTTGFLVLSRPGFNAPSVRAGEDLEFQAVRAQRGFKKLRAAADALPPRGRDMIAAIQGAPTNYNERCLSFCDRAPGCWQRAVAANDPEILGEDVARFLGLVTIDRALALLEGKKPRNTAEEDLARRLETARLPGEDS